MYDSQKAKLVRTYSSSQGHTSVELLQAVFPISSGLLGPGGIAVPGGKTVPGGSTVPRGRTDPAGSTVPSGSTVPAGSTVPSGTTVPGGGKIPPAAGGIIIPAPAGKLGSTALS